jgi:hypothetical protein
VNRDAGVGQDHFAADGDAEDSGRLEDAGEEVLLDCEANCGIIRAFEDGVVVGTALGVDFYLDDDGQHIAAGFNGLRRHVGIEQVRAYEVSHAVVVCLNGDAGAEDVGDSGCDDEGCGKAAGETKRDGGDRRLPSCGEAAERGKIGSALALDAHGSAELALEAGRHLQRAQFAERGLDGTPCGELGGAVVATLEMTVERGHLDAGDGTVEIGREAGANGGAVSWNSARIGYFEVHLEYFGSIKLLPFYWSAIDPLAGY